MAAAEPLGDYHRVGMARGQLAVVLGSTGEIEAGLALMEPILRLVDSDPDGTWIPGLGTVLGELHRWRGDFDDAVGWLERDLPKGGPAADLHHQALAIRMEHRLRQHYPASLEALAGLLARSGRRVEAARTAAAADHGRGRLRSPRPPADAPWFTALAAELRTDPELKAAWDDGAELDLDTAVAYARRMRGARGRPDRGWDSLTPTERDVVRLAAEGLSNPEIGVRLFMSRAPSRRIWLMCTRSWAWPTAPSSPRAPLLARWPMFPARRRTRVDPYRCGTPHR